MSPKSVVMRTYWKDHLTLYAFVTVLIVTGIIFGLVMVSALTMDQKQELARHMGSFFQKVDQGVEKDSMHAFRMALSLNVKWLLLIWLLGLSVVGLPIVFALDFLKGVLIGFSVGYLTTQYAWEGVLFSLVSVAPPNLFMLPILIITSVSAVGFSLFVINNRFLKRSGSMRKPLIRYLTITFVMLVLVVGVSVFEVFVSPQLMNWVTPMLISSGMVGTR